MKNRFSILSTIFAYLIISFFIFHISYFISLRDGFVIADFQYFNDYMPTIKENPFIFVQPVLNKELSLSLNGIFTLCFLFFVAADLEKKRKFNRKGVEYGSAKWGKLSEYRFLKDSKPSKNLILSNSLRVSTDDRKTRTNANVLIFGTPGSGKSRSYVIPNILQAEASYIITDTKGDLYNKTSAFLEEKGYKIKVLNLNEIHKSSKYNPFYYLENEEDVNILTDNLISNTNAGDNNVSSSDPFWEQSQKALFSCIISYLTRYGDKSQQNFTEVLNIIHNFGKEDFYFTKDMQELHDKEVRNLGTDDCLKHYRTLMIAATTEQTLQLILLTAAVRISFFTTGEVANLMSKDELDFLNIAEEKTALYIVIPETTRTFNVIACILYSQLFEKLMKSADKQKDRRLKIPVMMFLDEFANLGKIPNFLAILATIRSRGISASIIFQGLAQLKEMYKDNWETFFSCCSTTIFLGSGEKSLLEYLSALWGKETTHLENVGRTKSKTNSFSRNENTAGRELITLNELYQLKDKECIVSILKYRPFKDKKFVLEHHKNYKKSVKATENKKKRETDPQEDYFYNKTEPPRREFYRDMPYDPKESCAVDEDIYMHERVVSDVYKDIDT